MTCTRVVGIGIAFTADPTRAAGCTTGASGSSRACRPRNTVTGLVSGAARARVPTVVADGRPGGSCGRGRDGLGVLVLVVEVVLILVGRRTRRRRRGPTKPSPCEKPT